MAMMDYQAAVADSATVVVTGDAIKKEPECYWSLVPDSRSLFIRRMNQMEVFSIFFLLLRLKPAISESGPPDPPLPPRRGL